MLKNQLLGKFCVANIHECNHQFSADQLFAASS